MILKLVIIFFFLVILSIFGAMIYQNLPGEEEPFNIVTDDPILKTNITYGETPMFMDNIRFDHRLISYSLSPFCDNRRKEKMGEAFSILEGSTKYISFKEVQTEADIFVSCSEEEIEQGENLFRAGEGGPSKITQTGVFNIIQAGEILLYRESKCSYPVVEIHELLHVFGFDHSLDPKNVMYNVSDCDQRITSDEISTLDDLYGIEALPDFHIEKINATKSGRYLNFELIAKNQGLKGEANVKLTIYAEDVEVHVFQLEELTPQVARVLKGENYKLPSRSTKEVRFVIDSDNHFLELDEENNEVKLAVE